jgi:DeoR/GlpR family transcriptional regulator of sugar metabolism
LFANTIETAFQRMKTAQTKNEAPRGRQLRLFSFVFVYASFIDTMATESDLEDADPPLFPDERQSRIAELVATNGKVYVTQLVKLFDVTEATLRKDLNSLEQKGLLKRTHGGAVSVRPPLEQEVETRIARQATAKAEIAKACVELVNPSEAIFLDCGTTVREIAKQLVNSSKRVMVLTSAPVVAETIADVSWISHVMLGGVLRRLSGCLSGPLATEHLRNFAINTAFIGVSGITEAGITVADLSEAQLKAAVIERARRVVVPLDHSKVGLADFSLVCPLDRIDIVVTDAHNDHLAQICQTHQIQLIVTQKKRD